MSAVGTISFRDAHSCSSLLIASIYSSFLVSSSRIMARVDTDNEQTRLSLLSIEKLLPLEQSETSTKIWGTQV